MTLIRTFRPQGVGEREFGSGEFSLSRVRTVLRSAGRPLGDDVRHAMEPHFGIDFRDVRVHTDSTAASSVEDLRANAYAVRDHVVFSSGKFQPHTSWGRQLIAHELAHVVQQRRIPHDSVSLRLGAVDSPAERAASVAGRRFATGGAVSLRVGADRGCRGGVVQRDSPASTAGGLVADADRGKRLDDLRDDIATLTGRSMEKRAQLDIMAPASSSERTTVQTELNRLRADLIPLLQERIRTLDREESALLALAGPAPTSDPTDPTSMAVGDALHRRESERRENQAQLGPLLRWRTSEEIRNLNDELTAMDRELATLPPVSDPNDPQAENLAVRREEVLGRKRQLARSLTSSATEYKQFDPRWSAIRYGRSASCTDIGAAGCGPTSLAIVLNYLYGNDPEALAGDNLEIVRPPEAATYAESYGRVCNSGTAGDTMVTNVHTGWPGFRGLRISLSQATDELRNGNLVIFLCKSCAGRTRSGGSKSYGGHYMVLSAVSVDGAAFDVLDPGARESGDIETISRTELETHSAGFWIIERQ